MYDIRQFKPTLYVLVMLGIIGFALAAQAPAIFLLAGGAVVANAWLVATNRFTPMPRLLANGITLLAFLFVAQQVVVLQTTPIIIVGQFLVLLQVVKLYEQRLNRDYAQLLVLSLLLMVAASITTASLFFGVLLIAYLFLSLYCCLLFHLKVETDHARSAYALAEDKVNPAILRQDQRYLSRSMRRLTGLVSGVAILTAIIVFLIFPRGTGANLLGPLQMRPSQSLTGFSDQMNFQQIANITQNTATVAYVNVWKQAWNNNDKTWDPEQAYGPASIYLRGTVLDRYEGTAESGWRWSRSAGGASSSNSSVGLETYQPGEELVVPRPVPEGGTRFRQYVTLLPTNTPNLFAMPYPTSFTPRKRPLRVRYVNRGGLLLSGEPLVQKVEYEVTSTEQQEALSPSYLQALERTPFHEYQSTIDPRIKQYLDEIKFGDLRDKLADPNTGKKGWAPNALDEEIARKIEQHLQQKFGYTLDLTEFGLTHGDDPIVRFLTEFKRGHCEYFAGAMTLLCQSLNIRSRVVIGFKCDEYSDSGNFYNVRQSHAHAWVEVQTPSGWKTFDPTSGRAFNDARSGLLQRMRSMLNFMEFTWATSVIAYDNENRDNLISNVNTRLDQTAVNSWPKVQGIIRWVQAQFEIFASRIVGPIMVLLVLGLVCSVIWFAWERWRLRRRAERIGLDILPTTDQLRLVRQLGFYDDLLRLLERHNMTRPVHQTPKEFADSLAFLPSETYDTVRRLTQIFYKIRFGRMKLTGPQQRRLHTVLHRLAHSLGPMPEKR